MSFDSDVIEAFLFYLDNEMPYSLRVYLVVELKEAHIKLHVAKPVKLDLNKKLDPKQKTIQTFNINA